MEDPRCMHCGKPLRDETAEYCQDCRKRRSFIQRGCSVWVHRYPVSSSVYRFKYRNRRSYGNVYALEMAEKYGEQLNMWKIDLIVPIPLFRKKKKRRGYNQAEILAKELSRITGIPMRNDVLFRIRETLPQKNLDNRQRMQNLQGAFAVPSWWEPEENVLLVDDIYTTGSTLEHAAKILKKAGVQNVYFLTISIGQDI